MGMMVGAGGIVRTISYGGNGSNGTVTSSTQTKSNTNQKKRYKKLNYNYKEISGKILRAKTSTSARQTVISARTKVAALRRKYGCGEYNDKDLEIAIVHAEKMVRIAKKKLNNLKAEEQAERTSEAAKVAEEYEYEEEDSFGIEEMQPKESEASKQEFQEMIRQLEQELQELERENKLDELTDQFLSGGKMNKEDLDRWRKKHRCDEMRQIVEADMKYLKAMFQRMVEEQQELTNAAILEISNAATNTDTPVIISVAMASAPAGAEGETVDASV